MAEHDAGQAAAQALYWRAILAGTRDFAIIVTDPDGRVTDWNSGAEQMFGWSAAAMRGASLRRIFTAEDQAQDADLRRMQQVLAETHASEERWYMRAGGTRFLACGEMAALYAPDRGHPDGEHPDGEHPDREHPDREHPDRGHLGFVTILRDRSIHGPEQAALLDRESWLRTIVNTATFPMMLHTDDGEVLELSQAWSALTGYSRAELATIADWIARAYPHYPPEMLAQIWATAHGVAALDGAAGERTVRTRDGGTREWNLHAMTFGALPDGRRLRLVVAIDVTGRKAAEAQLRTSEARLAEERGRLAALVEHLPIGVCITDAEGRTLLSNPAFRRFVPDRAPGPPPPEQVARWSAHGADGAPLPVAQFPSMRALRGEDAPGTDFLHFADDGSTTWTRNSAVPLRDADGRVTGVVGVIVDIDAEKRALKELQRLNETLEQQVEARTADLLNAEAALRQAQKMEAVGQLTGGIAHDFNNLLTAITGNLDLLAGRLANGRSDGLERFVNGAQNAALRAAALTHRLLAFSRRQMLTPRPTDIDELVGGMGELINRTAGAGTTVAVQAAPALWSCLIDRNQMESALLNLAINARDAMPGGGRLTIATANRHLDPADARALDLPPGDYIVLSVADTGTGMPPDVAARAFDPFFTTKPVGAGTGLGLSMVYGFVRQSGGQVRIDTAPGAGTTITLWLPRTSAPVPGPNGAAVRRTVLVVEDDTAVLTMMTEALRDLDYHVRAAADAAAALAVLDSDAPVDLLVADLGLPGAMNGRQLAMAAQTRRPALKVLFITGYAADHADALPAGAPVLVKPFAIHTLASRIGALVAG